VNNPTMIITFDRESLEISIDAPEISLDFGISLLDRAKRVLEAQEKIVLMQKAAAQSRIDAMNEAKTGRILDRVKLQ
jgi:hypothetical protein